MSQIFDPDILNNNLRYTHYSSAAAPAAPPTVERVAPVVLASDEVVAIKGMRKAMVTTMMTALQIPHFGYCDEVEVSDLIRLVAVSLSADSTF